MPHNRFRFAAASYLILRDGNKVLLSLRQNTGWMDGMYTMVSGHLEPDEAPAEAMAREAREEAGIEVRAEDLRVVHVGVRQRASMDDDSYVDFYLECPRWKGEIRNMEPDKCGGLEWFSIDALPENMLPYLRLMLDAVARGERYSDSRK